MRMQWAACGLDRKIDAASQREGGVTHATSLLLMCGGITSPRRLSTAVSRCITSLSHPCTVRARTLAGSDRTCPPCQGAHPSFPMLCVPSGSVPQHTHVFQGTRWRIARSRTRACATSAISRATSALGVLSAQPRRRRHRTRRKQGRGDKEGVCKPVEIGVSMRADYNAISLVRALTHA